MKRLSIMVLLALPGIAPPGSAWAQDEDDDPPTAPPPRPPANNRPPTAPPGAAPAPGAPGRYPPSAQYPGQPGQYPDYPPPAAAAPPATGQPTYPAPQYPYYQNQPQGQYPAPYGYPQQYPPPYSQPSYPPPSYPQPSYPSSSYPQAPYGQPPAGPATGGYADPYARPAPPPAAAPALLTLTTSNDAARADASACMEAIDNYQLALARAKCEAALAKDGSFALAHLFYAQVAETPQIASTELQRAVELAGRVSPAERHLITGWQAQREGRLDEARAAGDGLVASAAGDRRAFIARGLLRQGALGDLEGALADFRRAAALDDKYAATHNFIAFALAEQGKVDEARSALQKYATLAPSQPNPHDSLATLALRAGELAEAASEARKALNLDPKFWVAHLTLGDALLLSGKLKEARREYELVVQEGDAMSRHQAALRLGRSWLAEDKTIDAERALIRTAAAARKGQRSNDAVEAFLDAVRIEIERGGLGEAARGLREAGETLRTAPALADDPERRRLTARHAELRTMALALLDERVIAEQRADELAGLLAKAGEPRVNDHIAALKGWIAYKAGDEKAALAGLARATRPLHRLSFALALAKDDPARARGLMEELARCGASDVESALARPRAASWLKPAAGATTSRAR